MGPEKWAVNLKVENKPGSVQGDPGPGPEHALHTTDCNTEPTPGEEVPGGQVGPFPRREAGHPVWD